jgi:PilZ domain
MRAPRFPLQLALAYRPFGADEWRVAETENISRSGVLIRAKESVDIDTQIELRLKLPTPNSGGHATPEVTCRGRVVRTVSPSDDQPLHGSAIAIDHYDFVPAAADTYLRVSPS